MTEPRLERADNLKAGEKLTAEETRRRQDAVRFADASMRLEGFVVSTQAAARAADFVAGIIDLEEFVRCNLEGGPSGDRPPSGPRQG